MSKKKLFLTFTIFIIATCFVSLGAQQPKSISIDFNFVELFLGKEIRGNTNASADLFDYTDDFKGKVIRIAVIPEINTEMTLRNFIGETVQFRAMENAPSTKFSLYLPNDIKIPAATWSDCLYITFSCKNGSLFEGNIILQIERAYAPN